MNKQQMLNGMSEEEFYSMYPTEEDYVMAMGGQAGNDDFYVPHQDADRLRASTPINFINTPFYNFGGASDGPLGYFGDGGRKKKNAKAPVDVYRPEINPNTGQPNTMTSVDSTGMYNQMQLPMYDPKKYSYRTEEHPTYTDVFKKTIKSGYEPHDPLAVSTYDQNVVKQLLFNKDVQEGKVPQYPPVFWPTPEQQAQIQKTQSMVGTKALGGDNPSPMNYGAFPVMMGGGEFTMIINDLLKKQFGGNGAEEQSPSIDNVLESKRNFFNNYIRGNVSKSFADEMHNEMQQMMMGQSYRQQGGSFNDVDANTVTGNNENLSMQMQDGGGTNDEYSFMNDVNNNNNDNQKFGPPYEQQQRINTGPEMQTFPMITNQDLQNRNEMQVRTNQENQMNDRFMKQPKKNYWWNGVDVANGTIAQMQGLSNLLESSQNAKQAEENKKYESGDYVFQAKPEGSSSRGDYDPNSGDFRKNQYTPVQFPGFNMGNAGTNEYAQMGGGFKENDDVYMSDEEIQQYLAAGGEIEFLD